MEAISSSETSDYLWTARRYNPENDIFQSLSFIPEAQDKWKYKGVWGYERVLHNDPSFTLRRRVAFHNEITLRPPTRSCVGAPSSGIPKSQHALCVG
jgi:hypothetical protein